MSVAFFNILPKGKPIFNSYYKFDEITGDAIDYGNNNQNAKVKGNVIRNGDNYQFTANSSEVAPEETENQFQFKRNGKLLDFVVKCNLIFDSIKGNHWFVSRTQGSAFASRDYRLTYASGNWRVEINGINNETQTIITIPFTPIIGVEYVYGMTHINGVLKVFLDGVVIASLILSTTNASTTTGVNALTKIGGDETQFTSVFHSGKLNKVFIQKNKGWTDQEILDNFNNGGVI